jgi:uncharacterized membrane protein
MNLRPMLAANSLLVLGMAGASAWAWSVIPDAARLPVHWNLHGEPDRFGGKEEVLVMMPLTAIAITAICWIVPYLDPRRANMAASAKFWNAAAIMVAALIAYVHGLLIWKATGHDLDIANALIPAMCLLFMGIGNYLGKTRSNWFGGIRTPWTMSSDYSWERTHRWTGRLFVVSGLAGLAAWLALDAEAAFVALLGGIAISVVCAVVMSYLYWRADPDRTPSEG